MAEAFREVNTSQLSRFGAIPKIFTSQYVLPLNATRLILNKIVIFEVFDFEGNHKNVFHNMSHHTVPIDRREQYNTDRATGEES